MEVGGLLEFMSHCNEAGFIKVVAHQLQSDWKAIGKAAGY